MKRRVNLIGLKNDNEWISTYGSILDGRYAMMGVGTYDEKRFIARFKLIDPLNWILVKRDEVRFDDAVFIDEAKSNWWHALMFDKVHGLAVSSSLGTHWSVPVTISKFHHSAMNSCIWDTRLRKYVIYRRDWTQVGDEVLRLVTRVELDTLHGIEYVDNQRGGDRDEYPKQFFSPLDGYLPDIPHADFYTFPVVQVRSDLYIATPTVFIHDNMVLPHTGTMQLWIFSSSDGIEWRKVMAPYASAKQVYALNGFGFGKYLYFSTLEVEHGGAKFLKRVELYCDTTEELI